MMRALIIPVVALSVGCGPLSQGHGHGRTSETHQKPSNLTPGVHVSGYANVGVVKEF